LLRVHGLRAEPCPILCIPGVGATWLGQAVKDFHDRSLLVKAEHDAMQVRP